nr:hypothetical protein BaRGS_029969 [Batillaria attramentaria]
MKNYKIGVLGLSETRWLQTGQLRFSSGEQLLYSGHTEDGAPHTEGVALMLAPEAQRALIGWEPVNSRIITAKFITKKKDIKLNIIQCYAPTNDAEEEKKDDFYQQLQTVIDRGGAKDMTILMGDFNAKIGSDNTGYEDTMGTHGLGQMNENGERFADFCALNQLVIGGSIFPHKRIHKATWRSPDHVTENQIDHICISRKFRRSWRDVRVMRGADVSSDHHLLATTLRLRLKRHTNANSTRTRYNVGLLRNTDTQAAFRISLSNRFQPLQDLIEDSEMDIETQWEHSKKLWHDTCEEVLGKRKTQHKEWISADTIQKLEVRKEKKTALNTSRTRRAKAKAQEEYTAADREVKRSTRKDKRDYIDNLASQAEEAARQGNLKDLYQVTKKLTGKFQQTDKPVKDKNGHPLTTTEEQLKRWAEHFRELLNRPIPETPPDIPPAETELPINCDKPSKAEIRKAIMTLRNGKAAGPDEIPAEAIKADTETAVNMLHSLFSKIWEKEEVPAQWKEGIVIKLPKKGDLRDCSNYRGIMLLSVPGKVLNRILLERMREAVDPMLRDQQAGFRRNRSCADQIASLRIIVEQSLEWNSPLYINFIDYEKAFDSVDREALWKLLRHYGVPGKIISLIQCTYQDMSCRIAHAGQLSESFEVKTGVRQGCLLSPFLFLLVIDWIMKTTTAGRKNGIQWTLWTQLDDLDFADDLALLSHSHSQTQDKTTCLEATSAGTGLKINRKKTELMKINTTANTPVTVGGEPIREVESFVYLGSVVDGQGGTDRDVTARIGKARAAMVMLKNVWASKVVSIRTKLRIFNSNVKSVLLYGCETWRTTKTMQQKIQTFLNTCLRRIFNIRWPEKIRNEELWERAGQEPVAKQILRRKWGWIGHTLRKPASSTTRQALTWNPQGKRKRGRPRNSWRRDTEAELCKQGTNWTGVARLAQNRVRWRRVVDGLCSTWSQGPKKAPGKDGIPPEVLKSGKPALLQHLHELLCLCWEKGHVLQDMRDATIITLYKNKGDRSDCNNYRGISLLSIVGKVFARVVLARLQSLASRVYPESQCGFRASRSTMDMIFSLRQLQKCREQQKPLYIAFIDLTKAFDLVSRSGLFSLLQKIGCPPRLLQMVKSFHEDMHSTGYFSGGTSDAFPVSSGVKQGCVLAPTLFGIFFSMLLQEVLIREMLFADDAALTSHTEAGLQELVSRLSHACKEFGLTISLKKTNILAQDTDSPPDISIDNTHLEVVDSFTYLGSTISSSLTLDTEISTRIGKAAAVMAKLSKRVWSNSQLTENTKLRIYKACILSTLLYGSESWTTYASQEKQLNTFPLRCLRRLLHIKWQDRVTNTEVLQRAGIPSLFSLLSQRRLKWLGHVRRMEPGRIPKDMLYGELREGHRKTTAPL